MKSVGWNILAFVSSSRDIDFCDNLLYYFLRKGFGVFATEDIDKGSYICEYHGEMVTPEEGSRRLEESTEKNFVYFYQVNGKEYWWV